MDELIEKAARAIHEPVGKMLSAPWEELPGFDRDCYRKNARAALEAILPDVVEECAREAAVACYCVQCADNVPDAIRALRGGKHE